MSRWTIQNATGRRCAHQAVALARAGTTVAGKATPTLAAQLSAVEARAHRCAGTPAPLEPPCWKPSATTNGSALTANRRGWSFYTDAELAAALTRDALPTAGQVSSGRTTSRIRALQQQIRPLHSGGLAELDEEITAFLRRTHDDEDIPI